MIGVIALSVKPMFIFISVNRAAAWHDAILGSGRLCPNILRTT